jgi:hypothetical protein
MVSFVILSTSKCAVMNHIQVTDALIHAIRRLKSRGCAAAAAAATAALVLADRMRPID